MVARPSAQAESAAKELRGLGFGLEQAEVIEASGSREAVRAALGSVTELPMALTAMNENSSLVGKDKDGEDIIVFKRAATSFTVGTGPDAERLTA